MLANTNGDKRTTVELEDAIMRVLPPRVAHWLRYDSAHDVYVGTVFRAWRQGATEDTLLRELRSAQRRITAEDYGRAHPQAEYSTAA